MPAVEEPPQAAAAGRSHPPESSSQPATAVTLATVATSDRLASHVEHNTKLAVLFEAHHDAGQAYAER
jgi:hypothetical protein